MRAPLVTAAAAAIVAAAGWAQSASAQVGVDIQVGPRSPYYSERYYAPSPYAYSENRYGPRVYGYTRRYDTEDGWRSRRNGCGTYRYWNGESCVDARGR